MTDWTSATLVHVHLVFFCGTSDVLIMKGKRPCYVWIRLLYHTSIHVNLQIYMYRWFTCVILLPQKFLPFDWLIAEVFQLFEIPTCENYSYYGNSKSPNNLVARGTQKWQKDFEILKSVDSRTKRKFGKPKYRK